MSGSRVSNAVRFDVEKFDGKINFGLWQIQVKDVLIQSGLHKALKGRAIPESSGDASKIDKADEDWEDLDLRAASTIRLCLAKNVLANVHGASTAKGLWEKLEELYQTKGVSNRLYLKEQFHTLQMNEGTTISDHLSVLNGIVSELESIGVKIDDEDQAIRLILSLPRSYEHMKPLLIHGHGKEKIIFSEVTSKLLSEERRLGGSNNSHDSLALVARDWKKKNSTKNVCWRCGQPGHIKKNCKGRAGSVKSSESARGDADNEANIISDFDVL